MTEKCFDGGMVHVIISRARVQQPALKRVILENCVNDAEDILQTAFKEAEVRGRSPQLYSHDCLEPKSMVTPEGSHQ